MPGFWRSCSQPPAAARSRSTCRPRPISAITARPAPGLAREPTPSAARWGEHAPGSTISDRVLFAVDQSTLGRGDRHAQPAGWLAHAESGAVTIEGHADERGTRDYNFQLGSSRASVGPQLHGEPWHSRQPDFDHHLWARAAGDLPEESCFAEPARGHGCSWRRRVRDRLSFAGIGGERGCAGLRGSDWLLLVGRACRGGRPECRRHPGSELTCSMPRSTSSTRSSSKGHARPAGGAGDRGFQLDQLRDELKRLTNRVDV